MGKQPINATDLSLWMGDTWHLYASQNNVRLWVSMSGQFKVTKKGALFYLGDYINNAVKKYNENL